MSDPAFDPLDPLADPVQPTASARREKKPSLVELLTRIPEQVQELIQREIELVKTELTEKFTAIKTGAILLVVAAVLALYFVGVLFTLAIIGLSALLPAWAAALIVAGVLLIVAVILGLVGYRVLMRGIPPVPTEAIESINKDVHAITGRGKRGTDE